MTFFSTAATLSKPKGFENFLKDELFLIFTNQSGFSEKTYVDMLDEIFRENPAALDIPEDKRSSFIEEMTTALMDKTAGALTQRIDSCLKSFASTLDADDSAKSSTAGSSRQRLQR